MSNINGTRNAAYARFERARRQARIEQISAQLSGRNKRMIPFAQIRAQLKHRNPWYQGVQEIPVSAEDTLDDLLIRFGEQAFLEETELDKRYPTHNIRFTSARRYTELLAQIEDLGKKLAIIDGKEMPYYDAIDSWFEMIYLPTTQIIRDSTLLDDFPGRSESDLFVWMSGHREGLRQKYGEYENLADLATMLAKEYKEGGVHKLTRQMRRLLGNHMLPPLAEFKQNDTVGNNDS
ncbi:MAG: hypothetical protein GY943_05025 [Chloroflexi bacterium]|nr:hypothetical protein [Chloroflexota bacterium]